VTLSKFFESSSASFDAADQFLYDHLSTGQEESVREEVSCSGYWWLGQEGTYLKKCTSSLHDLLLVSYSSVPSQSRQVTNLPRHVDSLLVMLASELTTSEFSHISNEVHYIIGLAPRMTLSMYLCSRNVILGLTRTEGDDI